jgi:D-alanyl-D-alanine carboxypeptidase/D-alanyl-D-alanine-endopeptidase (penicillin-binding protein 4)
MKQLSLVLLTLFFFSFCYSQDALSKFVTHNSLRTANISVFIKDMKTGKVIAEHRANQAAIPASTMKVITTATALELLGAGFTYETILSYDGTLDTSGTLNGNVYIVGSGDPTLGSSKMGDSGFLKKWVTALQQAGIKKINGNIIGDDSRFDNEGANSKWTWDDIGNYYAPGIWGIAYRDNTVAVTFQSGAPGSTPAIIRQQPQVPGMTIDNFVTSTKTTSDNAYFFGSPKSLNRVVRGEIPANRPSFVVRAELPNPALLLAQDVRAALTAEGIEVSGGALDQEMYQRGRLLAPVTRTTLYTHTSLPLSEIIKEANQKSNNFYTEQIFKSLSLSKHPVATNQRSIELVRQFWRSKGLDTTGLFMEDGSGLSPANAVSARFFTELMHYMYQQSTNNDAFVKSLAVAGKVGTLAGFLKNTPLDGKLIGKSGTISRVRAYTGYITNNREWAFTVLVNNSATNSWQTLSIIEDFLKDISK